MEKLKCLLKMTVTKFKTSSVASTVSGATSFVNVSTLFMERFSLDSVLPVLSLTRLPSVSTGKGWNQMQPDVSKWHLL